MIEVTVCPVCSGSNFLPYTLCIDHTVTKEPFTIKKCEICGLLLTSPRPPESNLGKYYKSDNYISHATKAKTLIGQLYLIARRYTLRWKFTLIKKYSQGVSILDYGCGTGEFLKYCYKKGLSVSGVEPAANANERARKLLNSDAIYENLNGITKSYAAITLWHVLEHIPDLNATLSRLRSVLDDDGVLLIAVPNANSWDSQHYGANWAAYDTPRHLWHFTRDSMKKLLTKNELTIVQTVPMKLDAFYISLMSEKYRNQSQIPIFGMVSAIKNALISNRKAKRTGDYSSLIYVVKK